MNYPILAAQNTWWKPNVSTVTRASITEIEIMDSYTPNSSETVVDLWDASAAKDGSITCYVIGTKLIIAGNGSGMIAANEDSSYCFNNFTEVITFNSAHLLDMSNVKIAYLLFESCKKLTQIDVSTWNTENFTNLTAAFAECSSLENIDVSKWNVHNVFNFANMFQSCTSLTSLDLTNWAVSNIARNFFSTFLLCESLVSVGDLSGWNVSEVTSIIQMFGGCENLESLGDVSSWNLDNVTSCYAMFQDCTKLKNLNVSNWGLSSCTDMSFMFYGCSSLGEINVSNWDVSKVTKLDHFAAHAGLRRIGMEKWNTSSLVNANAAFHNCAEEELDLSGWDVSKVQIFGQMFENSPNLKRIKGLENWDTSSGLGFEEMFERCYKLEEIDLSSFDTSKAKNGVEGSANSHKTATLNRIFYSCNNLKKVTLGPNFSINGDGTNTNAEYKLILPTPSTDYIEGADGMWYTFNGDAYAPNAVKDRTYNTYYASKNLIHDLSVRVNNGTILDIVKAIREKVPNLEPTLLSDLDDVILSKVFEPVLEVDEEGNAIITATALSIDEEGNATVVV